MNILAVNHVQVSIPIGMEDDARRFYCGLLGLREVAKPASLAGRGGLWLMAGSLQVHLGAEDGVDRMATRAHVAYEVDDLEAWRERLISAEITLETQPPIPGYSRFLFRDPFGNRIEFLQRASGF